MALCDQLKRAVRRARNIPRRLRPRFSGAYPDRDAALAHLPAQQRRGYDDAAVAEISFAQMCQVMPWDYPVLFWLQNLMRDNLRVLDAGGHMGTKYLAFSKVLALDRVEWTVLDLPEIIAAARRNQDLGALPKAIVFQHDVARIGAADVLLASGLLQYLDVPFETFLSRLAVPPAKILLNKVALREGKTIVTLEQIGPNRVPYQIRSRQQFERGLVQSGYRIVDTWAIPELGHVIPAHPLLGRSSSRGYFLERV